MPAALDEPPAWAAVADDVAALQGCERGLVAASTLHLAWDLLGGFAGEPVEILLDDGTYPILKWGVERAAARGVSAQVFRHHDVSSLRSAVRRAVGRRPLIVTDGFCPTCGAAAPLPGYLDLARRYGGYVIVDDTQALGILGVREGGSSPWGSGGGGSLRWWGLTDARFVLLSSMAKGFGAPLAVLAGSGAMIRRFKSRSETRVHCSPPSQAAVAAAAAAIEINKAAGDEIRERLVGNVERMRSGLRSLGFRPRGGDFPVQTLHGGRGETFHELHARLAKRGLRAVLHSLTEAAAALSFVVTANHAPGDIDRALEILGAEVQPARARRGRSGAA